ncbi:hypothetical protein F5X68DRAFT_231577 [Plectosphaerella plurivora]|uniref:Uncharacterized protein n=1 Tax=Plectosphaerella plurivora TaxID=936078 RepID=A0A9P8VD56_9PEZI|nr:hypothetical protein F5X68DRAFT_231577 [Plectosphaerella plurivora]
MSDNATVNNNNNAPTGAQPADDTETNQSLPHLEQEIIDTAFGLESIPKQVRNWQFEGEDSLSALGAIVQQLRDAQEHLMEAKLRFDLKLPPPVDIEFHDEGSLMLHFRTILREISKERDEWGDYADLDVLGAYMHRMVSLNPAEEVAEELVYESARTATWFKNNGYPSEVTKPLARFWDQAQASWHAMIAWTITEMVRYNPVWNTPFSIRAEMYSSLQSLVK